MAEEKGVCKYSSRDGQEITLSFQSIKNYLVSGNREKVTDQELIYFMGVCKSRGLNPFKKDAYLIKYGDDPAAIVTSIDYFRSRARAQKDCVGWKKGIVVEGPEGVRDSAGLIKEGEKLLGGFFEATPHGWKDPFRLEVNLKGYIKKTKDGRVTKFWSEDNQPSQIAKVAESQGLRTLWPDEFQGVYEETEIRAADINMAAGENGTYTTDPEPINTEKFDRLTKEKVFRPERLNEFIKLAAEIQGISEDAIKAAAQDQFDDFWSQFMAWAIEQEKTTAPEASTTENGKAEGKDKLELKGEAKQKPDKVLCPNSDKDVKVVLCDKCKSRTNCPAWDGFDQAA